MSVCPRCGRTENQSKIGTTPGGSQRWRCGGCGKRYTPEPKQWEYGEAVRLAAIRLFVKVGNLRQVAARLGMNHTTLWRWIKRYGPSLATRLEKHILRVLNGIRRRHGGEPVSTTTMAAHLMGRSERTVRYWLVKMERKGLLRRPSPKGGWLPAGA